MNPTRVPRLLALSAPLLLLLVAAGCTSIPGGPARSDGTTTATLVRAAGHKPPPTMPHRVGSSSFDLDDPQISNLDPDLLAAVERAARAAGADGVPFSITSGWRSRSHQQRLFDEAVSEFGSTAEAERHVSTPDKSAHVRGDAVDVGPPAADSWLHRHGADYGLCQSFANERWHFELTVAPGGTCPAPIPDSSYR